MRKCWRVTRAADCGYKECSRGIRWPQSGNTSGARCEKETAVKAARRSRARSWAGAPRGREQVRSMRSAVLGVPASLVLLLADPQGTNRRRGRPRDFQWGRSRQVHVGRASGISAGQWGRAALRGLAMRPMSSLTIRVPCHTSPSSLLTWPLSCCVSCSCLAAAAGADKGRLPRRGGSTCLLSAA